MKNGERAGKSDCWTRMPVHPESAIRGRTEHAGRDMQVTQTTVKHNVQGYGWGYPGRQNRTG